MIMTSSVDRQKIEDIVRRAVRQQFSLRDAGANGSGNGNLVVSISARHVHLTQEHVEKLFGAGQTLKPHKDLYQDGFYAAEQTVMVVGPRKRMLPSVVSRRKSGSGLMSMDASRSPSAPRLGLCLVC